MKVYRGYLITTVPHSPTLLRVSVEGQGGKIPNILSGMFTSLTAVKELVDRYLESKENSDASKANKKG